MPDIPSPSTGRGLALHAWRRARRSGSTGGNCVEVAASGGARLRVRDSKDPEGPTLTPAVAGWNAWLRLVNAGHYDIDRLDAGPILDAYLTVWLPDGLIHLRDPRSPAGTLRFTAGEWTAFLHGAAHGEFTVDPATGRFVEPAAGARGEADATLPRVPAQRRGTRELSRDAER